MDCLLKVGLRSVDSMNERFSHVIPTKCRIKAKNLKYEESQKVHIIPINTVFYRNTEYFFHISGYGILMKKLENHHFLCVHGGGNN